MHRCARCLDIQMQRTRSITLAVNTSWGSAPASSVSMGRGVAIAALLLVVGAGPVWAASQSGRGNAATGGAHRVHDADDSLWVGSWAASQQLVEPNNSAPAESLRDGTLRQLVHL